MIIRALGIDTGFANAGFCLANIDMDSDLITPFDIQLVQTTKIKKVDIDALPFELLVKDNKKGLQSYDDFIRIRKVVKKLRELEKGVDVVMTEMPSTGAINHNAAKALAYALAIMAFPEKPVIQIQPRQVKLNFLGDENATKREMIVEAHRRHPDLQWLGDKRGLFDKNEHMADAIAVLYAGIQTEQFERYLLKEVNK